MRSAPYTSARAIAARMPKASPTRSTSAGRFEAMDTTARFSDGLTAATREVRVRLSPDRLALMIERAGTDAPLRWPLGELRALPDHSRPDEIVLTHVEPHGDETQVQPRGLSCRIRTRWRGCAGPGLRCSRARIVRAPQGASRSTAAARWRRWC
jgi:hypothetical protein